MSALQQIQAIIDYFFGSDVELRDDQSGVSELWARDGYDGELTKFAILYGDDSLTDVKLCNPQSGEAREIKERYVGMIYTLDVLIRKLEDYTDIGHIISLNCRTWRDAEVNVVAMYENVDYDEDGEPYAVEPPVIARFRFDRDQDALSAR